MLFYAVAALMEFLMNPHILGPSAAAFKAYYILSAPLVGMLGSGVVYLLWGEKKGKAVHAYPLSARRYSIIINIVGGTVLVGGAAWSYLRDRPRTYNLWIFLGGLAPMVGGGALGLLGELSLFFIFTLLGTALLYWGFILSDRFIKAREARLRSA